MMIQNDITLKQIFQARDRIDHVIRTSPVVDSPKLSTQLGRQIPFFVVDLIKGYQHAK